MDIKAILKRHGIEGEAVNSIAETINAEIPKEFVSKAQYNKKIGQIDDLQNNVADLEAKLANTNTDEYKSKYEEATKALEDFKKDIETKEINKSKSDKVINALKEVGFNEKIVKLISKDIALDKIEIEEDKIKDWDSIVEPYKNEYSDFIQADNVSGNVPGTPFTNNGNKRSYTRDEIKQMSSDEIYSLYKNDPNFTKNIK